MKNASVKPNPKGAPDVQALRSSPVHNLVPLFEHPVQIELDSIELDPTNPGSTTQSLRNERREGSIRDSYDILSRIVYPVLVCQKPDGAGGYIHIDGFGRLAEARRRGQKKVDAIVYPPLTLEQRICLRQTLNAAQEPFDAVSIIHDLQQLAKERGLDTTNPEDIKSLVRDLPERVRKYEKDLIMLARLHPTAITAVGESYRKGGNTIGLDQFRNMAQVLRVVEERHPRTISKLGGTRELSLRLSKMYLEKKFSEGTRSQDAIRRVAKALRVLPADDPRVSDFFEKEKSYSDLELPAKPKPQAKVGEARESEIVDACQRLASLLVSVDTDSLTPTELRVLERTASVLTKVLGSTKA